MKTSIIIVNYRSYPYLEACVRSLRSALADEDYEIIVVDNASTPEEQERIRQNAEIDLALFNEKNVGFGAANNRGAARARGDYLFFLNPDCLVLNDAVRFFLNYMESPSGRDVAVLGCALVDGKGNPNHYCGSFQSQSPAGFLRAESRRVAKSLRSMVKGNHGAPRRPSTPARAPVPIEGSTCPYRDVDWINGAALFMRKNMFLELGGFDEGIFLFSEEVDLQYRIAHRGLRRTIIFEPKIAHLHEKGRPMSPETRIHFYNGLLYYIRKHYSAMEFFFSRWAFLCFIAVSSLIQLATKEYSWQNNRKLIDMVLRFK